MRTLFTNLANASLFSLLLFAFPALGQDTNAYAFVPATRLESFATNIGTVVVKGTADIGAVLADAGSLTLKCREVSDASSGRKELGISVDLAHNQQQFRETRFIDYDELEPLVTAIAYLNKVDWSITSLNSFDAAFTTRSGFRASAFSSRRSSAIEFAVRTAGSGNSPILLTRDQMAEFRGLLEQARARLDSIHAK